jgi:hypothetical protein
MKKRVGKTEGGLSRWSRLKRSGEKEKQTEATATTLEERLDPGTSSLLIARQGSKFPVKSVLTEKGFVQPMPPLAVPEDGEATYEAAPKDALALLDLEIATLKAFPSNGEDELDAEGSKEKLTPEQVNAVRDLPPVETLNKNSDFTPFFKSNVPDFLKRHAFKALWASSSFFNFRDGLDDYDENFRFIDKLITAANSDYKVGKGYGLDDEADEDDLGDGEDDVVVENEKSDNVEETVVATNKKIPDENSEKNSQTNSAKDPRKSDVRPPKDAV